MAYDSSNIFAQIIRGEIPSKKVFEDSSVLAFEDAHPAAPIHVLVVPKGEYESFDDFTDRADTDTVAHFFRTIRRIAHQLGLERSGYRLLTNHGQHASQSVPHFHVHLLGGRPLGALLPGDEASR